MTTTTQERAALAVTAFLIQSSELADIITDHILDNFDDISPVECARSLFLCALESEELLEGHFYDPPAHVAFHYAPILLRAFGVENDGPSIDAVLVQITKRCGQPLDTSAED